MLNIFRRKNEDNKHENENNKDEVEFEYHNYHNYLYTGDKDTVEKFTDADTILVKTYGESYPIYISRDFSTANITNAQLISLILTARINSKLHLATKYTPEEIDRNPDLITQHYAAEDIALIRGSKSINGHLMKLALQHHQIHVYKSEEGTEKRKWRWF